MFGSLEVCKIGSRPFSCVSRKTVCSSVFAFKVFSIPPSVEVSYQGRLIAALYSHLGF